MPEARNVRSGGPRRAVDRGGGTYPSGEVTEGSSIPRWSGGYLAIGLLFAVVVLTIGGTAHAGSPLEPVDTSSPRATLQSFLALTEEAAQLFSKYRRAPSPEGQARLHALGDKGMGLLDLSQVPPIARREVGSDTLYLLWDVIARLELPELDQIPGGGEDGADEAALPRSWRVPHTEITIGRVQEGPEAGEYRFTPSTVERAHWIYAAARGLPYQRPMPLGDAFQLSRAWTGWMIPPTLVDTIPAWAKIQVLDQMLWKWIVVLLLTGAAIGIAILVLRWSWRRSSRSTARAHLVRFVPPLAVVLLARLLLYLVTRQINATGPTVDVMTFGVEIATAVALVWVLWHTLSWIAEDIIDSPRISSKSLDAQLIRLAARAIGFLAMLTLVFHVLNQLGVPVYGLVAGAGVGGIAVALAAKSTLENFRGALNLFADRPVRVGDLCRYDEDQSGGWRAVGTVEAIGLRSVKVRKFDRSLLSIPNAEFAQRDILNLSACDRFLLTTTLGLRYETTDDQLRFLLGSLRELLHAHPQAVHTTDDPLRVRFVGFGDYSLNVAIRAYIRTSRYNEFLAVQEDILLRVMKLVEEAGTGFAFRPGRCT